MPADHLAFASGRTTRTGGAHIEALEERVLLSSAAFEPVAVYPTVPNPRDTIVADFNGDAHPDIASAITVNDLVAVLLNNGDGTFTRQPYITVGSPQALAAADFNRDGHTDLAVTGNFNGNPVIEVFNGNGDGTFARPPLRIRYNGGGRSMVAADLNGDGLPDLLVTTFSRVGVLMNLGNGTFAKPVYYPVGTGAPTQVVVSDFNNDHVPDLAVARGATGSVSILLGNPGAPGTFGPPRIYPAGGNPFGLAVADFNHDGNQDLAVVDSAFGAVSVSVLLGNGNGTFRPRAAYGGINFADAITAADFNGDGNPDIVIGSFTGPLRLFQGNGDGTFATPVVAPGGPQAEYVTSADLNGDGRPDLISTPSGGVRVILNAGPGTMPPPASGPSDQTIGGGGARALEFFAPDGTRTDVSLIGPGSATLHFSSSSPIQIPYGRDTRPVTGMALSGISASGTTSASTLKISTANGGAGLTLGSISADGAFASIDAPTTNLTGALSIPGGAGRVSLLSANNGSIALGGSRPVSLLLGQSNGETISSAAPIAALRVRLDLGTMLSAPSIGNLSVGRALHDSTITLTAPFSGKALDLGSLTAASGIENVSIRSSASIGAINAAHMYSSIVYAGVGALSAGQEIPSSATDFVAPTTIRAVSLGRRAGQPSFANSIIAAQSLGTLDLSTIQTNNGGVPFGLAAHTIARLSGTDPTTRRSFSLMRITSSAAAASALAARGINPGDFIVRLL